MVAKVEQTDFSLQPSPVDIAKFVQMKSQEYTMLCYTEIIIFQHDFHSENMQSTIMNIDANRITQVLDNIVMNGIRYTPKNGIIKSHTWKSIN